MTRSPGVGRRSLIVLIAIAGLGSLATVDAAAPPPTAAAPAVQPSGGQTIATLEAKRGQVTLIRLGRTETATPAMGLQMDDIVVTKRGRATIRFDSDGAIVRVGPNSRVQVNESATERDVTLFFGRVWAHVVRWKERTTRFRTSSTIAAIRGTELSVGLEAEGDETRVAVLEGTVETSNDSGNLTLTGGQSAVSRKGAAPARSLQVTPSDAVQWALYYLPVLSPQPGELSQGQAWQGKVDQSTTAWSNGDLEGALAALEGISDQAVRDPGLFVYRASLLLAAGEVESAGQDLDRALAVSPDDADALAVKAIVAVAQNDTQAASASAGRAVSLSPDSATARIALSYAQQAEFDLEGARASLEKAVELAPDDALAWARLAEIHSSLGRLGDSLEAAQKAVTLQPNLARTQTVLGFAYLTRVQTTQAKEAFQKAIELDADDPLPRLGQGLARIRGGDLTGGLKDLEVAVSLNPADSVARSYLGKGYYEAKRGPLDEREYGVAEQADPMDPTPPFYQAIAEQTTNRPVEGLGSLQEAIELNDNRAVYRSRLLLDQDLAARSASQARIYSNLGFQDRALVEGWTSVNRDPSNYSAHRFLADSYAALPRHEIARVSELLQSQLLQPLNTTAIQPRLAESNLFLVSAEGPASLSFNEYNPLFNRNGVNLQGSGLVGQDGLWSGEGIFSGIHDKLSFSVGYNQFETDGWRENASQEDKIGGAFLQFELSPSTSLQAEYRYRDRVQGDLQQRFFEEYYLPGQTIERETKTYRVGGRHVFSPGSTVLANVTYQNAEENGRFDEFLGPGTFVTTSNPQDATGVEGQYLFRSRHVDVTAGVGYFKLDGQIDIAFGFPGGTQELPSQPNTYDHVNTYAYANVKPHSTVIVTVGGSYDTLDGDLPEDGGDQFNPKFGVLWNPHPSTTIRAAAFKVLKRTLITDQTLEPTQVAGFNQFFDDFNLTEAKRYGAAIDQKLGQNAFAGFEYSERDLTVPLLDFEGGVSRAGWDESFARAYLFATPHRWVGLRGQYIYEHFKRTAESDTGFTDLKTQRVPLGVAFFHPSGLSVSVTATYWDQEGTFQDFFDDPTIVQPGTSHFWLVDAAVSYRLPKRRGFISVGVTNLFDKEFQYFEVDPDNVTIQPSVAAFARITLAVP